jgi:hypothetical protein
MKAYCSPNIIRVSKPKRMRWVEHVASIRGDGMCTQNFNLNIGMEDAPWELGFRGKCFELDP